MWGCTSLRQGDKVIESNIFSLNLHLKYVERVRLHNPAVSTTWVSCETQETLYSMFVKIVFMSSNIFFRVLFPRLARQDINHGKRLQDLLDYSFANTIISYEADQFVGNLRSNTVRMIDEFCSIGGRLLKGFLTFIVLEW